MMTTETQELLEIFRENLPQKPYCYDKGMSVVIRNQEHARQKDYIQYNQLNNAKWLYFDCNLAKIQDEFGISIPTPQLILINHRDVGDDGVYYCLENGVHLNNNSREAPKSYLRASINTLSVNLDTNPTEVNFIGKNPIKIDYWHTTVGSRNPITLGEIAVHQLLPENLPEITNQIGFNRNQYCHDVLRKEAYKKVFDYKISGNIDSFFDDMLKLCQLINRKQFKLNPLHKSEIYDLTRNIVEWCWYKYTGKIHQEKWNEHIKLTHTSEIQALRGIKSGIARASANEELRVQAIELSIRGQTIRQIAEVLGVGKSTIARWIKN